MKIKAVIFDLDGVIVSTDALHYQAWKKVADREGIYFDGAINHRLRGVSRMECLDIILERSDREYSNEEKLRLADAKNNDYKERLKTLTADQILPNVVEILGQLKHRSVKIAIGSSSKNAHLILELIGIKERFDAIADGNDIQRSKPFPDVFLVAAAKLGIKPEHCMVVEDAEAGIEAAKAAGMTAVAVGEAVKSLQADYCLSNLGELMQHL